MHESSCVHCNMSWWAQDLLIAGSYWLRVFMIICTYIMDVACTKSSIDLWCRFRIFRLHQGSHMCESTHGRASYSARWLKAKGRKWWCKMQQKDILAWLSSIRNPHCPILGSDHLHEAHNSFHVSCVSSAKRGWLRSCVEAGQCGIMFGL
jgi:hypothetical protein